MPFAACIRGAQALVHAQRCRFFRERDVQARGTRWVGGFQTRHAARETVHALAPDVRLARCCLNGQV